MAIIRHGYVGDKNRREREKLYKSPAWQQTSRYVRDRAGNTCGWCGKEGRQAVRLGGFTLELLRQGRAFDLDDLACGCVRCHASFAAKKIGRPPGR